MDQFLLVFGQFSSSLVFFTFFSITELLYGMLLHQGTPSRSGNTAPPKLPILTLNVVKEVATLLHRIIRQHLNMVQDVLSQEGISLEFRHIISYLLWYCQAHEETELMHEAITLCGYFAGIILF